jgi:hypothetical protein
MLKMNAFAGAAALVILLLAPPRSHAGPWLPPGDLALRNDIVLLADAGVLTGPMTTWPLAWADIARDVLAFDQISALGNDEASALTRVRIKARKAMAIHEVQISARASGSSKPRTIRTFEATPRENGEVEAGAMWTGERFAFNLQAQVVSNAQDDKTWRVDGSYLGIVLGNVMFAVDTQDRWWGPGWEGSQILSNNARSVPSIIVQRNQTTPFKSRWLSWIGPWTASWIWGQMEDNRTISNTRLWGFRFGFRPISDLEIALSRTAQWCGEGRPCDFDDFLDLLEGTQDNRETLADIDDEPGNQLAAIDFRWGTPIKDWPFAIYGQMTAEDEADNLPSRWIALGGVEVWGVSPFSWLPGNYRLHIEATDTASEFYDEVRFDFAYEHFIYQDGYRYRGRPIGHALDNDGQMYSVGGVLNAPDGSHWQILVRRIYLNRGGVKANSLSAGDDTLWNLELSHTRPFGFGTIDAGIGFDSFESGGSDLDDEFRFFLQWRDEM